MTAVVRLHSAGPSTPATMMEIGRVLRAGENTQAWPSSRGFRIPTTLVVSLLAAVLFGALLLAFAHGGQITAGRRADLSVLPVPSEFSPADLQTGTGSAAASVAWPTQRAWTTTDGPDEAMDAWITRLTGAGWAVEDRPPQQGALPRMPHVARVSKQGAVLYLDAIRLPAESRTRVVAVLDP